MTKHRISQIRITVNLDEKNMPTSIDWDADDRTDGDKPVECKGMLLSLFERETLDTMKIDLWATDMQVNEMDRFFLPNLEGNGRYLLPGYPKPGIGGGHAALRALFWGENGDFESGGVRGVGSSAVGSQGVVICECYSFNFAIGIASNNCRVYSDFGWLNTSVVVPISTILPSFITAMRSLMSRTTLRSWEMKR